jgi:two-component system, chemotaxis family, protein-glutamate methylesterase/glutaminase
MAEIKVVIVDDSAVVRSVVSRSLTKAGLKVVGVASNPFRARDLIVKLKPDVITLDLEMPRMDGLTFLQKLMYYRPMPVVVLSSLTPSNSENALSALELGAVEVLEKPGGQLGQGLKEDVLAQLARAVKEAAVAKVKQNLSFLPRPAVFKEKTRSVEKTSDKLVVIGASTGGTEALYKVITRLPADFPGVLVVQHMPPVFTHSFAQRLNSQSAVWVKEAQDQDWVMEGRVLIAPGNYHMLLRRSGAKYKIELKQGPLVHHMRPSVDVLFHSAATAAGSNALGVIMTGMGKDGAAGLKAMHDAGSYTLGQDEKSCVVYGMPKEAFEMGAVDKQVPLEQLAPEIIKSVKNFSKAALARSVKA